MRDKYMHRIVVFTRMISFCLQPKNIFLSVHAYRHRVLFAKCVTPKKK